MYLPRVFESTPELTRDLLRAHPFATVVGVSRAHDPDAEGTDDAVEIVHVPLLVDGPDDGAALRIMGHVARANPFARLVMREANVTAAFHGPDAYVSASLYGAPREQVPTWNYAVVHVRGRLRPLDDAGLAERLGAMAERFERGAVPWHPDHLSPAFFAELRRGIVGFAIEVAEVRAKLKLSQNRTREDRDRVEAALGASAEPREREVAALMRRVSAPRV
jgi:transcriptional regulator